MLHFAIRLNPVLLKVFLSRSFHPWQAPHASEVTDAVLVALLTWCPFSNISQLDRLRVCSLIPHG